MKAIELIGAIVIIGAKLASIVGAFLCGINVLMYIFDIGGSYGAALAGLLMCLIGKVVCGFAKLIS